MIPSIVNNQILSVTLGVIRFSYCHPGRNLSWFACLLDLCHLRTAAEFLSLQNVRLLFIHEEFQHFMEKALELPKPISHLI